jgi:NAD(P)-dependent dehydrogenase (short-subunit alcohol dehydrogenase family)
MGSVKEAFDLTGKSALVTGGSRRLGLQIAEALGKEGAKPVISSRKRRIWKRLKPILLALASRRIGSRRIIAETKTSSGSPTKRSGSSDGWIFW